MDLLGEKLTLTTPDQVPGARAAVRQLATKATSSLDVIDNIELMASEAIANGLLHGSGQVTVAVFNGGRHLRVEVCDGGPANPAATRTDHGRGLQIIEALAANYLLEHGSPTRLWFDVDLQTEAPAAPHPAPPVGGESGAGNARHRPAGPAPDS